MKKLITVGALASLLSGCVTSNDAAQMGNIDFAECAFLNSPYQQPCKPELSKRIKEGKISQKELTTASTAAQMMQRESLAAMN
ncbi:TPA: hypothetical protein ACW7QF_001897 [Klebsiella aerogenes]|uniref:hypothetical protein n=1 Tax=Klebsiella TaxID=570 RepID=UPI00292884A4|nr:hypothetical protein [Klebsiella sp. 141203]MDU9363224.1 hypothetical protein [Klebsiella sp. 141203]HEP0588717.1 hypothetical protein [Klebsiella aerogenes]